MNAESVKASYRAALTDTVTIRRYTGSPGVGRAYVDYASIRARVVNYQANELIGGIIQGDRKLIVYADDLTGAGFTLPLTSNDKVIVRGKEMAITAPDDNTRRIGSTLIAYELTARG